MCIRDSQWPPGSLPGLPGSLQWHPGSLPALPQWPPGSLQWPSASLPGLPVSGRCAAACGRGKENRVLCACTRCCWRSSSINSKPALSLPALAERPPSSRPRSASKAWIVGARSCNCRLPMCLCDSDRGPAYHTAAALTPPLLLRQSPALPAAMPL